MTSHLNHDGNPRALLDATCRVALAGLLHDLGKLAERADMPVRDREILEVNKQTYCPNPKPHPNAADVIEPLRPHVDEWVWMLFRERVLAARNFRQDNGAVLLDKTARQHFYARFHPLGAALRRLLRRQMHAAAREFEERGRGVSSSDPAGTNPS